MDAKTSTEALELLTTAVTVLDGEGRILDANAAAEILFGRARRRLAGRSAAEFLPEAAAPLSCEGRLRWGRSVALTTDLVIAPEAQERVRAVVHKLGRATEKPEGFLLEIFPLKDVLLQERERLRAEERAAGRDLLRNLAHEVKNPLGGIRGAAQLLEADLVRPEDRECTTMILEEADRLEALVERILLPYRAGGPAEAVDVCEVLERVRALLLMEFPEGLAVERDYDVSAPPVWGDRGRMMQIFLNLARNAAEALKRRMELCDARILLRTRVEHDAVMGEGRERRVLRVDVEDNGPGIPPELIDRIFYPLVTGRAEGSGLGLSIVKNFVEAMAGTVSAESRPGRTVFTVRFRLKIDANHSKERS